MYKSMALQPALYLSHNYPFQEFKEDQFALHYIFDMANRVLALMGSNKVSLEIATEITLKGKTVAKRMIDAIDPDIIKVVAQKVERAWDGDVMFSPDDKAKIKNVQIT